MRGNYETANRWNAHYARQAAAAFDDGQRYITEHADTIPHLASDLTHDQQFSAWSAWRDLHPAVKVADNQIYHHHGHQSLFRVWLRIATFVA